MKLAHEYHISVGSNCKHINCDHENNDQDEASKPSTCSLEELYLSL